MMKTKILLTALIAGCALASPCDAAIIAGVDFNVGDGDTEPGYLGVAANGTGDYNVTHNGITFVVDGTSFSKPTTDRDGAIDAFNLEEDFIQYRTDAGQDAGLGLGVSQMQLTISGLTINTQYIIGFNHWNQGAFQNKVSYWDGTFASGDFLGSFSPSGTLADVAPWDRTKEWALTSDGDGKILVTLRNTDNGDRLTVNGFSVTGVPEPGSLALLGLGGLLIARRRRN